MRDETQGKEDREQRTLRNRQAVWQTEAPLSCGGRRQAFRRWPKNSSHGETEEGNDEEC